MKKTIVLLLSLAALGASAAPLTCSDALNCAKMWSNAQKAVGLIAVPPIRLLTADRIETFPPRIPGTLGITVMKVPLAIDSYEIDYQFACFQMTSCDGDSLAETGGRLFESMVRMK